MSPLHYFIPLLLIFELAQLVISERYLGVKQVEREADPRTLGLGEVTAFFWSSAILLSWVWMALMLFQPRGARIAAISMILITGVGYFLRRNCSLRWILVILTFEGALRVGMLLSMLGMALRGR